MPAELPRSILAIGAHMDDCWLGMGGTALKALRKGCRVTMVTAVSNYRRLPFLRGRDAEIERKLADFHERAGVRAIALGDDYMRVRNTPELQERLSQIILDCKPDLVFGHAEDESNFDHTMLGIATRVAATHGECFTEPGQAWDYGWGGEVYQYTTGWQAKSFVPDTFVDVSDAIFDLLPLCNFFDDLYANGSYDATQLTVSDPARGAKDARLTAHARFKFAQSIVYGGGGAYAEGFKAYTARPINHRRLAGL